MRVRVNGGGQATPETQATELKAQSRGGQSGHSRRRQDSSTACSASADHLWVWVWVWDGEGKVRGEEG